MVGLSRWLTGKESMGQCRRQSIIPSLGRENPLEKEMATHSSILAWEIPWTEEPGGNPMDSPWGHKDLDTTEWLSSNTPHESPSSLVCILHYCYCSQVILLRCIRMLKLHSCFFQFSPGAFSTWRTALSVSTVVVLMLDILFVLIWDVSTSISFLSYTFLELKET